MDTYMIPYLANDQWDEGIVNGYLAFVQEVKEAYAVDIESKEPLGYEREDDEVPDWLVAVFIGVVIVSFALGLLRIKIFSVSTTKIALVWLGLSAILFAVFRGIAVGIGMMFISIVFFAIGRGASPKAGKYVAGDSDDDLRDDDKRYRSSSSSYSSSSGSRSYSGGGGTSSGGGATRGF